MEFIYLFLGVLLFLTAYLSPSLTAHYRHHHQRYAITALNVFLGWTMIGWVTSFVWALSLVREEDVAKLGPRYNTKQASEEPEPHQPAQD